MKRNIIDRIPIILGVVLLLILAMNAFCQDARAESYREGYGAYGMMGQDPDAILKYGNELMRYGFHETGMSGGLDKYPGYEGNLKNKTINKLNIEQKAFIIATENLRQTIYEKELYLKAELVKKDPDAATALRFQNDISEDRWKFEQKMIAHVIRMKKINSEAEGKLE